MNKIREWLVGVFSSLKLKHYLGLVPIVIILLVVGLWVRNYGIPLDYGKNKIPAPLYPNEEIVNNPTETKAVNSPVSADDLEKYKQNRASKYVITDDDYNDKLNVFYYTEEKEGNDLKYSFYKVSGSLGAMDKKTHSIAIPGSVSSMNYSRVFTNSGQKGIVLFVINLGDQGEVYALNVTQEGSLLRKLIAVDLDKNKAQVLGSVRFLGEESLAYITAEDKGARAENSVLHIVSLKDVGVTEIYFLNKKSPIYASFRFLAGSPDNRIVYLDETGGDGGWRWSKWYTVDRDSKKLEKI